MSRHFCSGRYFSFSHILTLSSVLLISIFSASFAHAIPALGLGEGSKNGPTVSFPLMLTAAQGSSIASIVVDIKFDTGKLSLIMNAAKPASAVAGSAVTMAGKQLDQAALADGVLRLVISGQGSGSSIGDGVLAAISFTVVPGADPAGASFFIISEASDVLGKKIDTAPRVLGDILGRGQALQLRDSLLILFSAVGAYRLTADQYVYADMNRDRRVDVGDAMLLLSKVVGL